MELKVVIGEGLGRCEMGSEARDLSSFTQQPKRGRKPRYHDSALARLVFLCWLGRERMCAKRLVLQLSSWLEEYERSHGAVDNSLRSLFLSMSAATIDRVLQVQRAEWYRQNRQSSSR